MKIQFLGATRTVTGSCFLIKTERTKFLVDCGLFQGVEVEDRNYEDFKFDPASIDFAVLTHAHIDHCALLPKLYKKGFRGKVYTTIPTRGVMEHMLLDSAKVQEIKFRDGKRKHKTQRKDEAWQLSEYIEEEVPIRHPIYDTRDVLGLLDHVEVLEYCKTLKINEEVSIRFLRVGHALGAASILLVINENGKEKKLLFSGDMGNQQLRLDSRFDYPNEADFVIMESLYGGQKHEDRRQTEIKFAQAINRTLSRGGNVLIPAFTYQRSQEMLYILKKLVESGEIPNNVRIYLDSPLAIKITDEYKKYYRYLNPDVAEKIKSGGELFSCRNIVFSRTPSESKKIKKKQGSIIMAGHGMCAGGRIIYHLLDNLEDKRSSVLFVGFQAEGTLGQEILEGKKKITIDSRKLKVKAEIVKLFGFSAHADNAGLLRWVGSMEKKRLKKIFLVHADEEISFDFKKTLERSGYEVVVPEWKKEYEI